MSKRYYESYLIIDGNLEDSAIEDTIKKYESFLLKNEVEIKNIDRIGRKRLSYQIKKRQNGYYVCFEMLSSPQLISKLERTFILDESILRYLTIFMSAKAIKEKEEHLKNRAIIQSKFEESKILAAAEAATQEIDSVIPEIEKVTDEVQVAVENKE
ncbi:MAG TPA: 30S ribosomal protein S6 [Ignavibacteria bacterium]|nr:30S ribosomal protein S6 [Ignavibacteria bacterium]